MDRVVWRVERECCLRWWFAGQSLADGAVEAVTRCKLSLEFEAELWKRPGCVPCGGMPHN